MTHELSRREQKALEKNQSKKPMITVDTKGMKSGVFYILRNIIAVFIFPFWMMSENFKEWVGRRRGDNYKPTYSD